MGPAGFIKHPARLVPKAYVKVGSQVSRAPLWDRRQDLKGRDIEYASMLFSSFLGPAVFMSN